MSTRTSSHHHFQLNQLSDLDRLVDWLVPRLQPGTMIGLMGPLGAGKTTLTQRIAQRLGVDQPIDSPTFVLRQAYLTGQNKSKIQSLIHYDFYRLSTLTSLAETGFFDDLRDPTYLLVVEWADRFSELTNQFSWLINLKVNYETNQRQALITVRTHSQGVL